MRENMDGRWKGDNVVYSALHAWVRRHISKPIDDMCQVCLKVRWFDLANITGIYNRDFENWQLQCRGCHARSDGREKNIGPCKGVLNGMFGRKHSSESIKKISQNRKGKGTGKRPNHNHNPKINQNLLPHSQLVRNPITGRFVSARGGE
jgi:hypothetical protein